MVDTTFLSPLGSAGMPASGTGRRRGGLLIGPSVVAGVVVGVVAGTLTSLAGVARADEPVAASEPRLMSETAEVTSVVDAFDGADPFDLNLTLGFKQTWKHANIHRETNRFQALVQAIAWGAGGRVVTPEHLWTLVSMDSLWRW